MGSSILIVEDDQPFAETLAMVLQLEGYKVLLASNAGDGIKMGLSNCPDLVVADWMLNSCLHGGDVCRQIRLASPSTKTIIITGCLDNSPEIGRWSEYGDLMMEKPFHKENLLEAVERALASRFLPHGFVPEQRSRV